MFLCLKIPDEYWLKDCQTHLRRKCVILRMWQYTSLPEYVSYQWQKCKLKNQKQVKSVFKPELKSQNIYILSNLYFYGTI